MEKALAELESAKAAAARAALPAVEVEPQSATKRWISTPSAGLISGR
jgi:hypothetical protein